MPDCNTTISLGRAGASFDRGRSIEINLNDEVLAAVEGWRQAHGLADQSEALSDLIVLGLMSEIGRIYRLATGARDPSAEVDFPSSANGEDLDKVPRRGSRSARMERR